MFLLLDTLQFSVFLGIIFFLELTAGVLAFVFKDWIKDQLNFFINNNIRAYRDDIDLQNLIDFTQEYVSKTSVLRSVRDTVSKESTIVKRCFIRVVAEIECERIKKRRFEQTLQTP